MTVACEADIVKEIGSTEFFDHLASISNNDNDFPLAGSIELTLRCNLRCRHCYASYPGASEREMTAMDLRLVLDRLSEHGVLFLLMTGGEILLREDFGEVYLYARSKGFLLTLLSNGTLVDEQVADFLARQPPRRLEITIYGHTPSTYEFITGVPGSFGKFRRGVSLLLERKLPVHLKMMILRSNAHEFEQVREWAGARGAPFRYDAVVNPRLDGDMSPAKERLPAADVARLHGTGEKERDEWIRLRAMVRDSPHDGRLFRCGAGVRTVHIDPRGQMHPCMMWRWAPFDILRGLPDGGWQAHVRSLRHGRMPADSACVGCADSLNCGHCAATSRLETGVAGRHADYYCEIAKAREQLLASGR